MNGQHRAPWWGLVLSTLVAVTLLAPVIIMLPMGFTPGNTIQFPPDGFSTRWFGTVLGSPLWSSRLATSVQVAIGATLLATVLGTMTAFALVRGRFRGKGFLWALSMAPLVVPVVVLATGEFFVMTQGWHLGPVTFGGRLTGTVPGLVLAQTVLALPYPTILVATSLATVDRDLELAAGSLGATPLEAFQKITLPLIRPGMASGAAFAFLTSWDEVVMTSFLTSSRVSTVPVQIFSELRESLNPTSAVVSTLLLVVSLLLFAIMALQGRVAGRRSKGDRT